MKRQQELLDKQIKQLEEVDREKVLKKKVVLNIWSYKHGMLWSLLNRTPPASTTSRELSFRSLDPYAAGGYFGQYKMMQKN